MIEEPQFQTLESYDLRACPVYAGEFALDSRAVRRVDNRRSVGGESVTFRTSFGRGRDSLESALDDEEEAQRAALAACLLARSVRSPSAAPCSTTRSATTGATRWKRDGACSAARARAPGLMQ